MATDSDEHRGTDLEIKAEADGQKDTERQTQSERTQGRDKDGGRHKNGGQTCRQGNHGTETLREP